MRVYRNWMIILFVVCSSVGMAQQPAKQKVFTHADTLRGSITPERAWWNVLRYDITVKPDYNNKTITGENKITYSATSDNAGRMMQIDMKEPLMIDSIILNKQNVSFTQEGNVWHVKVPAQKKSSKHAIEIFYSVKV